MANPNLPPVNVPLIPIRLNYPTQITVDVADAAVKEFVPFKCIVRRVTGTVRAIGGTTPHTDVDVQILKNTTEIVAALPVVDSSAIARPDGTLATVADADLTLDGVDDFLHLKLIDITGGSSPTCDGLVVTVWVERL